MILLFMSFVHFPFCVTTLHRYTNSSACLSSSFSNFIAISSRVCLASHCLCFLSVYLQSESFFTTFIYFVREFLKLILRFCHYINIYAKLQISDGNSRTMNLYISIYRLHSLVLHCLKYEVE